MNDLQFQVVRSLSITCSDNSKMYVGSLPPNVRVIDNPSVYLPRILEILSKPHSLNELVEKIKFDYPDLSREEVQEVFSDLINEKIIQIPFPEERYHRHQLYFNYFNICPEQYQSVLSNKKIGLIGAGGIGSTSALLLAAAGIGTLVLLDDDSLEESNLTRTILFEESDISEKKAIAAKARLESRNRHTKVIPIVEKCFGADSIKKYLSDCDVLLLSADTPPLKIQRWTHEASLALNIPYITAGYIETIGLVGPFITQPSSDKSKSLLLELENSSSKHSEINTKLQAPSYGPLNALVSSIAVNEILRYLLGLETKTSDTRILINSDSYAITFLPI
jgi:molybdopterin/thiamine biosynthesis adenylyltransferase